MENSTFGQRIREYNLLSAELLGFVNKTPGDKDFNIHEHKDPEGIVVDGKKHTMIETNFDKRLSSDWNWIMEIKSRIQRLECVDRFCIEEGYVAITCDGTNIYCYHTDGGRYHKRANEYDTEKEAIVAAMWGFLKWYKTQNQSNEKV